MINWGGWLLLTVLFALPLFLVQRAEMNRRIATALFSLFLIWLISSYGVFRMSGECDLPFRQLCSLWQWRERAAAIAYNTVNAAFVAAVVLNLLFWALIGRYNPPGTSEEIKVLGMND